MERLEEPINQSHADTIDTSMNNTVNYNTNSNSNEVSSASVSNSNSNLKCSLYDMWERIQSYLRTFIWPGLGLFGESYILFSVGTLQPIWKLLYPTCFNNGNDNDPNQNQNQNQDYNYYNQDQGQNQNQVCSTQLLNSLTYNVVNGIILGMIVIGIAGNTIGRRNGSILTASFMATASFIMTIACSFLLHNQPKYLFQTMSFCLFWFGFGVGGEYPLSATCASEKAMQDLKRRTMLETATKQQHQEQVQSVQQQEQQCEPEQGRGKRVILVFAMQGMGIFVNTLTLTFLLMITQQTTGALQGQPANNNNNNYYADDAIQNMYYNYNYYFNNDYYNLNTLLHIWQIVYLIGSITLLYVLISRILYLRESEVWTQDQLQKKEMQMKRSQIGHFVPPTLPESNNTDATTPATSTSDGIPVPPSSSIINSNVNIHTSSSMYTPTTNELTHPPQHPQEHFISEYKLFLQQYGPRLFGTSMSWLLWDVAFYGNKLFQSSFLLALTGEDSTLLEISIASTLNAFIALIGYYAAAMLVDKPYIGRLKLQQYGFLITGTLFCLCGFLRERLDSTWLIIMYFGSSFFGQCGPNCTTFLIPAEVFPTEMRTMCHGLSASAGKVGALLAAVMFHFLSESNMFLISGYCSFAACLITFLTIPETTTLDLYEIDRKWRMTLNGDGDNYKGDADQDEYLSFWEKNMMNTVKQPMVNIVGGKDNHLV